MSEQVASKEISDDQLRNTRAWAVARVITLSGAEVIVAACDEALAARQARECNHGTHFAFLIKRECDPKPWATIFTDRTRAEEYPNRASPVVPVALSQEL